ncbi:alpha/beta-Hydrolases superfamily protein [Abeliophyllum distichum]|uniref:Alpha/beta-Hydrolases superfamily protein n=1 Tax=Abeliophyllum distichum TaxID=126358 RepID=A0ABD1T286_9LAMI
MPPVVDGTERFMEIIDDIRSFQQPWASLFYYTKTSISKMGLTCHIAEICREASVDKNAKEIKDYIEEIYWGSGKRVLLLWHSKGRVDSAAVLSMYWNELKGKVASLALAQSPYRGSPIASDILREGRLGDYVNIQIQMDVMDGASTYLSYVFKVY